MSSERARKLGAAATAGAVAAAVTCGAFETDAAAVALGTAVGTSDAPAAKTDRASEAAADSAGAAAVPARRPGLVALVGAGPGRADLITVRGLELLERADVVVHDRLDTEELLARAGLRSAAGHARLVNVGKQANNHPVPQEKINELLVDEAAHASLVVRLKGGDPYVFGRGGEEASALATAGVPFEVVPGVSSALAAASYAGIPVTDRRLSASFHVLTGHRRANGDLGIDYGALVRSGGTWVFLMAVATLGQVAAGLVAAGADPATPACVVERGTLPEQRRVDATLGSVAEAARTAQVTSPAVLVVGDVCRLAGELDWYGALPLRGRTVAVTRPRGRAEGLAEGLRALGARVVEAPLIRTAPVASAALDALPEELARSSWLALTSVEGVRRLFAELDERGLDARALAGVRVAAVGPATAAELARGNIRADYVPAVFDTEHLALGLAARMRPDERALLFRSADGSPALPRILGEHGLGFTDLAAYGTEAVADDAVRDLALSILAGTVDAVTLTSSSCARALAAALAAQAQEARGEKGGGAAGVDAADRPSRGPLPAAPAIPRDASGRPTIVAVCLGAATRAAAGGLGMRCVEAAQATVPSLVEATVAALA